MMRRGIAALVAILALGASAAHGQDASAVVGRSARAYQALSSLKADFEQRIDDDRQV